MSAGVLHVDGGTFDAEVLGARVPVVVDFWAPWCAPCRMLGPEIEKLADSFGERVKFVKMNVDEERGIAMRYGVMSIPTVLRFDAGAVVAQTVGAMRAADLADALGLA